MRLVRSGEGRLAVGFERFELRFEIGLRLLRRDRRRIRPNRFPALRRAVGVVGAAPGVLVEFLQRCDLLPEGLATLLASLLGVLHLRLGGVDARVGLLQGALDAAQLARDGRHFVLKRLGLGRLLLSHFFDTPLRVRHLLLERLALLLDVLVRLVRGDDLVLQRVDRGVLRRERRLDLRDDAFRLVGLAAQLVLARLHGLEFACLVGEQRPQPVVVLRLLFEFAQQPPILLLHELHDAVEVLHFVAQMAVLLVDAGVLAVLELAVVLDLRPPGLDERLVRLRRRLLHRHHHAALHCREDVGGGWDAAGILYTWTRMTQRVGSQ
mmetsp:Transcript_36755/g.113363  ORF Transcript_36755/g.113363 Transcript_36755/m.113363 type:complete len:323 (+) Transcript_36755:1659-2627(+)